MIYEKSSAEMLGVLMKSGTGLALPHDVGRRFNPTFSFF